MSGGKKPKAKPAARTKRAVVRLDRIYTRGGDAGETSLGGGVRVAKTGLRVAAIGDVDEANAAIGLARAAVLAPALDAMLARVQHELFDLGAGLATVRTSGEAPPVRLGAAATARLEAEIDGLTADLAPLTSFVLPGGTQAASLLHLARTVARRAERSCWALAAAEPVAGEALAYLNRLSDLLFVMARHANDGGKADVLWRPGGADRGTDQGR